MNWLTDHKIPVGDAAAAVFDWLQRIGQGVFDAIANGGEALIEAILFLLERPPELVVIAFFVLLTWVLQRSWQVCPLSTALCLALILLLLYLALVFHSRYIQMPLCLF